MVRMVETPQHICSVCREYGINAETIACGKNATAMLPITGFTKEQEEMVNRMTDHVYKAFMSKAGPQS